VLRIGGSGKLELFRANSKLIYRVGEINCLSLRPFLALYCFYLYFMYILR
jgi:hypothetical protein